MPHSFSEQKQNAGQFHNICTGVKQVLELEGDQAKILKIYASLFVKSTKVYTSRKIFSS